MTRPVVAAVGGYMAYFEAVMGPGARAGRAAHLRAVTGPLAGEVDLRDHGLLVDAGDAARIVAGLRATPPDVLLVVPTMATPPGPMMEVITATGAPVVLACGHDLHGIGADYDMAALCRHSVNVGAMMVESLMRRNGLQPISLVGETDDPAFHLRLALLIRAAHLAARLPGLRMGRLGLPMPGYDHVGLSPEEAEESGIHLVDVSLEHWSSRVAAISADRIAAFLAGELPRHLPPGTGTEPSPGTGEDWRRAAALALALRDLAVDEELDCGSLTCRGPFGVGLPGGAIGCLATSLMTGRGRPFSATGDLLVALAMFIGRNLGGPKDGATLYCELDAIDRDSGCFLVANTGEGDFAWAAPDSRCRIGPAAAHSGTTVPGLVIEHDLRPGPATLVGAALDRTRGRGITLAAMEGSVPDQAARRTGLKVSHGWFRSNSAPAARAMQRWTGTGVTHHAALSRGHLAEAMAHLSRLAGFRLETVNE